MHVTEKLKQDIRSFRQRMLQERLLSAEKLEPRTGELEERVKQLKERVVLLNAKVRPTNGRSETKKKV